MAGLTAAIYLVQAGKTVVVLEKASKLGGRSTTEEKDGCFINLGAHGLYKKRNGMKVLRELGIVPKGESPSLSGKLTLDHTCYGLPVNFWAILNNRLLNWSDKKELLQIFIGLNKLDANAMEQITLKEWVTTYSSNPDLMSASVLYLYNPRCSFNSTNRIVNYTGKPRAVKQLNHSKVATLSNNTKNSVVHLIKYISSNDKQDPEQDEKELEQWLSLFQPEWEKISEEKKLNKYL